MPRDFTATGIRKEIDEVLKQNGITHMTPVQEQAIPAAMTGKDIIVQAQTGTGKTLAFLLPILEKIKVGTPAVQALIITPTRELALQITAVAEKLTQPIGAKVMTLYGGQTVDRQQKKLEQNPHIIIATPGRLLDHLRRRSISLAGVSQLVLDEADQMLHMGFLEEVEEIMRQIPAKKQTMFFSATIPSRVRALSVRYMRKPLNIVIHNQNVTLDEIKQLAVETAEENKLDKLCSMINEYQPYLAMVFCHTKQRVTDLTTALAQRGYLADELHGDLTQAKRTLVMRRFKKAKLQILVATDIAARGLDIEGVTHVFNYDIPHDAESYIHRIGRTGRAGEKGIAVTFVTPRQYGYLRIIEQGIRASLPKSKETGQRPIAKKTSPAKDAISLKDAPKTVPSGSQFTKKPKSHGGINQRSRRKPKSESVSKAKKPVRAR